jgi:hypothetical protein
LACKGTDLVLQAGEATDPEDLATAAHVVRSEAFLIKAILLLYELDLLLGGCAQGHRVREAVGRNGRHKLKSGR